MRFSSGRRVDGPRPPVTAGADLPAWPAGNDARARNQSGFSLVEILIAIVLVSLVISALAGGFLTMIRSSEVSSSRQRRDAALTSFTESLKAVPYQRCGTTPAPTTASYQGFYDSWAGQWQKPADAQVTAASISRVEFWDPTAGTVGQFTPSCTSPDGGAQRLTVTVTVAGRSATGEAVIRP